MAAEPDTTRPKSSKGGVILTVCGVNGVVLSNSDGGRWSARSAVEAMTSVLSHRGPDTSGCWIHPSSRVAFGHTRLAILDLSETGVQPMTSADGRWTITYNGEIYNTEELRRRLGDVRLVGHSDTEVLLEHIARHGLKSTVESAKGMFAFGCWDARESELWLARDRFGEKPLYYTTHRGAFLFASELKALRAIQGFHPDIDRNALQEYFRWTNVPSPMTIYEGVSKLPPAHFLRVSNGVAISEPQPYWSALDAACAAPPLTDDVDAVSRLGEALDRAVGAQMVADVPIGAFLSGGIDSSSIVASMQRQLSSPARTFTIGFTESAYDESGYAADVAAALGTDHTELVVSPEDAMRVIPDLASIYDEPFADSSQIPTYLVSQMAREHVTVALSGDGGDELFGGYDRYQQVQRLERVRSVLPLPARSALGAALKRLSVENWDRLGNGPLRSVLPSGLQHRTGHRMHKVGALLAVDSGSDVYASLMSIDNQADRLVLGSHSRPVGHPGISSALLNGMSPPERSMLIDTLTYLPDDLLTKVDRASMAVSLEVRVPFLDPDLFNFAWGLSSADRARRGESKWLLRELLRRSLPDNLIDRPKMGFGVPVGQWLRGPLRSWAEELLCPALVKEQGILDPLIVERRWKAHREGRADLTLQIWSLLMFQSWLVTQ